MATRKSRKKSPTFIDLFAGIGGMRMAFENAGATCVYSSEWDRFARETYVENFGDTPAGDVRKIESRAIHPHDILVAGFPCQPFSISGVSKKRSLGRPDGFEDPTQGTLFFELKRIIRDRQPAAFLLENVKNLKSHDKGRTFEIIRNTLEKDLGYHVHCKILDARLLVPQHRERIFIVGFREDVDFEFPVIADRKPRLGDILEKRVDSKYTLTDKLWEYLQAYAEKHRKAGNGFGFGLTGRNDISRTLSARYYKDGSEILIRRRGKSNPRRLTPRECARLMGYPDTFRIPVSDTQAYKQFGNSVVVPVVERIAKAMVKALPEKIGASVDVPVANQLPIVFTK